MNVRREIRQAVRSELMALAKQLRDTAQPGVAYDAWMRAALNWYLERPE